MIHQQSNTRVVDLDLIQQLQEYVAERTVFLEKYGDPTDDSQEMSRLADWSDRLELAASPH